MIEELVISYLNNGTWWNWYEQNPPFESDLIAHYDSHNYIFTNFSTGIAMAQALSQNVEDTLFEVTTKLRSEDDIIWVDSFYLLNGDVLLRDSITKIEDTLFEIIDKALLGDLEWPDTLDPHHDH